MEKIKYAKKRFCVNVIKHGEDYTEGVMADFEYPLTGVKRYYHTLFRLFDLRGCDRAFLDWLTEVMGSDNSVYVNDDEIHRFIVLIAKSGIVYKSSTVRQAFKRLRSKNLILKTKKASGLFHVNPVFFSKCTEKERLKNIRMLMEFSHSDTSDCNEVKIKIFRDMQTIKK